MIKYNLYNKVAKSGKQSGQLITVISVTPEESDNLENNYISQENVISWIMDNGYKQVLITGNSIDWTDELSELLTELNSIMDNINIDIGSFNNPLFVQDMVFEYSSVFLTIDISKINPNCLASMLTKLWSTDIIEVKIKNVDELSKHLNLVETCCKKFNEDFMPNVYIILDDMCTDEDILMRIPQNSRFSNTKIQFNIKNNIKGDIYED